MTEYPAWWWCPKCNEEEFRTDALFLSHIHDGVEYKCTKIRKPGDGKGDRKVDENAR
jgi:hypothetical protein